MALVRILVDGYSLLHKWPEVAEGKPRYSAEAREELVRVLTAYRDAIVTPITIVFDGNRRDSRGASLESTPELEIIYSRAGQTADQIIERVAHRMAPYGQVLAVTDDFAERDTVIALGGLASSCDNFIRSIGDALGTVAEDITAYNQRERARFQRRS